MKLADYWIERLGPAVSPFQRRTFPREILAGEATLFADDIFELVFDRLPKTCVLTNPDITRDDAPRQSRYLWVIDKAGLRLIREETPNPAAVRGIVCHTNITGGKPAFRGREYGLALIIRCILIFYRDVMAPTTRRIRRQCWIISEAWASMLLRFEAHLRR